MKSGKPENKENSVLTDDVIKALLNYPSLEKVFNYQHPQNKERTKQKMQTTVTELERIVRRGRKNESERAVKVITAYRTAIKFLDELEEIRNRQAKSSK